MRLPKCFVAGLVAIAISGVAQDGAQTAAAPVLSTPQISPQSLSVPPTVPAEAAASYVIGPSDVLAVTVWKEPALSGNMLVRPDGMISMSLLGDIQASDRTPRQLSDEITANLKRFIHDPNVSVLVSQVHSKVVYLLGEVSKKGPIELSAGMTLLQAIANAGGLTDFANKKKIYILRSEAGNQLKVRVHYKRALDGDRDCNLVLKSGDTIVVP